MTPLLTEKNRRLIVAVTGASGVIYAVRLLEILQNSQVETHLIISAAAKQTLAMETDYRLADVKALADVVYDVRDIAAPISSGSFRTDGMVVLPCSIKTLSGIAHSYDEDLIIRAADVILKERKPLVLCVRETPLHLGHLRLMTSVAEIGGQIMPMMPAFYHRPQSIAEIIDQGISRLLDQLGIELDYELFPRWGNQPTQLI